MSTTTRPAVGTRITTINDLFLLDEDTILVDFNGSGTTYHVADNMEHRVHVAVFNPYTTWLHTVIKEGDYNYHTVDIAPTLDMRIVFIPSQD
jgi:hypothetical protein